MIEYYTILTLSFLPEISFLLGSPFKGVRGWWSRMIEDSDGDPHHTDGLFIILLFAALWCFRIAIISGLQDIYFGKDLNNISITFLSAGAALLGVRIVFKPKLTLTNPNEK